MRENTKWIMLVTALAFVALMVFEWGMDMTGRSTGAATGEIGSVNGEPIMYEEWLAVYNNIYQQQQSTLQGQITPVMRRQIEEAAWDQIVTQRLLQQELDRRGIRVSDEEIRDAARVAPPPELQSAPVFQTDGQFDIDKYHQFLAQSQDPQFLLQLEAYYRDVIPRSKLFFQTAAGVTVSDGQLWRMYRDANETVTVEFAAFEPAAIIPAAQVSVTDEAVRDYYDENRANFIRPAQVDVRYVALNRAPPPADSAAAWQRAQELRAAAAGGEAFEAVAERATEGTPQANSAEFAVARGQSAPVLDQAVFSTPAGQITAPLLTQAGYHVIKVESRQGDTAQVRQFVVPIELSPAAEDSLLDLADELEDAALSAGLQQAAQRLGLEVQTGQVTPALPVLPGVGEIAEGLDWAMLAEPGETSEVFESGQSFYILELVSRRDEGPLPFADAEPTIRQGLVRTAQIEQARAALQPIEQRARAGEPLEPLARIHNTTVAQAGPFTRSEGAPGLGRLNAAVGAAFALRPGETSPLIEADGLLYLIRGVAREEANRSAWQAQVQEQRAQVVQALADTRWNQFLLALRESADIVDNRNEVLRGTPETASR
ncbi:MAG TPA: peptidylprolyl isomerase [Longimicrobiales bacterium]